MSEALSRYHRTMAAAAWSRRLAFIAGLAALVAGPGGGFWVACGVLAFSALGLAWLRGRLGVRSLTFIQEHARSTPPGSFVSQYQNPLPPQDTVGGSRHTVHGVICEVHPVAPMGGQGSFKLLTSDGDTSDWLLEGDVDAYEAGQFVEVDYVESRLDPRRVRRFDKRTGEESPALASDLIMKVPLEIRLSSPAAQVHD
ncbi:MAG: hypothetical protein ACPGU7_11365 [Gammaproteobacteria bacterium]